MGFTNVITNNGLEMRVKSERFAEGDGKPAAATTVVVLAGECRMRAWAKGVRLTKMGALRWYRAQASHSL